MEEMVRWIDVLHPLLSLSLTAAAVVLYLLFRQRRIRPRSGEPISEAYSALMAGIASDGLVRGEDLGAQLFNWAQQGCVQLRLRGTTWTILRGQEPVDSTAYERQAWQTLFSDGRTSLTEGEDTEALLTALRLLRDGTDEALRSDGHRLEGGFTNRLAVIVWATGLLQLMWAALQAGIRAGFSVYAKASFCILAGITAAGAAWLTGWYRRYYPVRTRGRNRWTAAMAAGVLLLQSLVLAAILSVSPYGMGELLIQTLTGTATAALAPLIGRYSAYGYDLLCRLKDLSDALSDAEKFPERKADESVNDYFFRMLPYAQVLGSGDEFAERFAAQKLTAPPWLDWVSETDLTPEAVRNALMHLRSEMLRLAEGYTE